MTGTPAWRAMRSADLPGVVAVAGAAHPDLFESPEVFAEKLALFANGCFALDEGCALIGYAFAHPWRGAPPALNHFLGAIPQDSDHLYVHDVALADAARGRGAGAAVVPRLVATARAAGLPALELVAVGGAERFWARHGFVATLRAAASGYGAGALRMRLTLSP